MNLWEMCTLLEKQLQASQAACSISKDNENICSGILTESFIFTDCTQVAHR